MNQATTFIGRQSELKDLRNIHKKTGSHLCVIYGRRRIGKTSLVQKAYENTKLLSFEGIENQSKREQIANFLFQLDFQTKKTVRRKSHPASWREALSELIDVAKKEPLVILLDELQWMANYRTELVAALKMIWDQYLHPTGNVTLILCGSIASFMKNKVIKSKALYGRTDLVIHLKPFCLKETAALLSERSQEEVLLAYLLIGGVPKYLSLLHEHNSILLGINQQAFTETGYFTEEYNRIFVSHFSSSEKYEQIIHLLATHANGKSRQEIVSQTSSDGGGELTRVLDNLESAGFIHSFTPFDKAVNSHAKRYITADPFMRFYFAFIKPFVTLKKTQKKNYFINHIANSPAFLSWLGYSFELTCLLHSEQIATLLGFNSIDYSAGPYFKHGKKGKLVGTQLDLVFDRADKIMTICEAKYQNTNIGIEVTKEVQNKINKIEKLSKKTIQKVLITKSPPTKDLKNSGYFTKIILAKELL